MFVLNTCSTCRHINDTFVWGRAHIRHELVDTTRHIYQERTKGRKRRRGLIRGEEEA